MKKLNTYLMFLLALVVFLVACQKELSMEGPGFGGISQGSLTDSSGNCRNALVKGNYSVDSALNDSNYVLLKVNFTLQGKYKIFTDTVNGMWFIDSGFALTTGPNTIKIKGYGKPILSNSADFVVTYNSSFCAFSITPGAGNGGSGGTGSDYFPTTTASEWNYKYIPKLGTVDVFTSTVKPDRFDFDNKSYFKFETTLQETYYFSKDGAGNYFALSTVDFDYTQIFDSIPTSFIAYPFLKENAAVGETWETGEYGEVKYGTEYGKAKAVFTIQEKGITYNAAGAPRNNVINVKRQIMFQPKNGVYRMILEGNSYYAKGIGLIDQVIPLSSTTTQSVTLQTYTIK